MKEYTILLGAQSVGQAQVRRDGLYYDFRCRCRFSGDVIMKIAVSCGAKSEILGTPVPQGKDFVLHKKLPIKYFGEGEFKFRAVPKQAQLDGFFVPIRQDEPFAYLNRLKNARLQRRGGVLGVVLQD